MKKIILLSAIFFIFSINILIGQIDDKTKNEKKDDKVTDVKKETKTENTLTLYDSLNALVEKFGNKKSEAIGVRQDTTLNLVLKNNKIRLIKFSASNILDELIQKSKSLDPNKDVYTLNVINKDIDDFKKYLIDSLNNKTNYFKEISKSTQRVTIYGDAGLITNNAQENKFSGNGSIGIQYYNEDFPNPKKNSYYAKGYIVLISSPDTLSAIIDTTTGDIENRSDFGATILNPTSGASSIESAYFEAKHYFWNDLIVRGAKLGITLNIGFSSRIWQDTSHINPLLSANVFGFNVGGFIEILPIDLKEKSNLGMSASFSYITRTLMGDITNNENFRQSVLGTTKEFFNGFELGFKLEYKYLSAFVRMPLIMNAKNIQGLSGGQFIGGANISIPLANFEL